MTHSVLVTNRSHFDGDLYSYPQFTRAASEFVIATDDASQAVYIFVDLLSVPLCFLVRIHQIYICLVVWWKFIYSHREWLQLCLLKVGDQSLYCAVNPWHRWCHIWFCTRITRFLMPFSSNWFTKDIYSFAVPHDVLNECRCLSSAVCVGNMVVLKAHQGLIARVMVTLL
jgi:hypothetical protein